MGEVADAGLSDMLDIEPSAFDLIVVGTGFQEALLAGCVSSNRQHSSMPAQLCCHCAARRDAPAHENPAHCGPSLPLLTTAMQFPGGHLLISP